MNTEILLHTKAKGDIGEEISCSYLKNKGFKIIDRNYRKAWGELDIVAVKDKVLHFFEVKSVTTATTSHRPEDNVHGLKSKRLRRIIQTYLAQKKRGLSGESEAEFQFHVLCVYMDLSTRKARIKWIKNLIL